MVSATVQAFLLDTNLSKSGEFICVYNFTRAVSTSYKRRKKPPMSKKERTSLNQNIGYHNGKSGQKKLSMQHRVNLVR